MSPEWRHPNATCRYRTEPSFSPENRAFLGRENSYPLTTCHLRVKPIHPAASPGRTPQSRTAPLQKALVTLSPFLSLPPCSKGGWWMEKGWASTAYQYPPPCRDVSPVMMSCPSCAYNKPDVASCPPPTRQGPTVPPPNRGCPDPGQPVHPKI